MIKIIELVWRHALISDMEGEEFDLPGVKYYKGIFPFEGPQDDLSDKITRRETLLIPSQQREKVLDVLTL